MGVGGGAAGITFYRREYTEWYPTSAAPSMHCTDNDFLFKFSESWNLYHALCCFPMQHDCEFQLFDFFMFCAILQLVLLHLGTDKWMCSFMRKVSLYFHLPGWETIKFSLIWYRIHWFLLKSNMNNLNLKKCLLSFFAECIFTRITNSELGSPTQNFMGICQKSAPR